MCGLSACLGINPPRQAGSFTCFGCEGGARGKVFNGASEIAEEGGPGGVRTHDQTIMSRLL